MTYDEAVRELTLLAKVPSVEYSLKTATQVIERLSLSFDYPIIHVGGTNGKGSVCCKLKHIYTNSGYKTGCYTSPHLFTIRERIQINGENISKEDFVKLYDYIKNFFEKNQMTKSYFGILTLMGLIYFKQQQVDIAIIEVGLGGRLDATNVINPILSIITAVQKDHMEILGDTLDKIAFEKAGIIKEGVPVILEKSAQRESAINLAFTKKAPIIFLPEEKQVHALHELICKEVVALLMHQFPVDQSSIEKGLLQKPLCRLKEEKKDGVSMIFDVAHNEASISFLLQYLQVYFPDQRFRFIVGFSKGRDVNLFINMIASIAMGVHLIEGNHPKLLKKSEILSGLDKVVLYQVSHGMNDKEEISKAFLLAKQSNEMLVFTGTFYIFSFIFQVLGLDHSSD